MKTVAISCSLAFLAFASLTPHVSAQRYDRRIDVPELVNPDRAISERGYGRGREIQARADIDRLNADVRDVRRLIGNLRDHRIRAHFHDVTEATDRLNSAFNRRRISDVEVRRRVDAIRAQLNEVRRDLRARYGRR